MQRKPYISPEYNGNEEIDWYEVIKDTIHNDNFDEKYMMLYKIENRYLNNNIKLNKQNEKIREITTNVTRERSKNAIISSITRQIASRSGFVGNSEKGRAVQAKIGRFKISQNIISY